MEKTLSSVSTLSTSRASEISSSSSSRLEEVKNKSYIDGNFTGVTKGDQPFKGKLVFLPNDEEKRKEYNGDFLNGNYYDNTDKSNTYTNTNTNTNTGIPHGKGKMSWTTGAMYDGEYKDG